VTARGLKSTRVICPDGVRDATVVVDGERIVEISATVPEGIAVDDVGNLVIAPGFVDCHVHINEPGRTDWEGFTTATRAAAAGGVTTLIDMPLNCIPVTTTRPALEQKLAASAGQLAVDVGFWGGVIPGNAGALAGLAEAGALGCKCFMVHSGIDEFPNVTESDLRAAMPVLRDLGIPLLAHAELDLGADVTETSARSYRGYLESRPPSWEDRAVELLVKLCRQTRCAVHIVHLSSASSVPILRAAKDEGLPITVETCPHYLCFEAEAIPDGATHYKCAPPIREHDNRERLWAALFEGVIDFVISDHSPCTPELKQRERGDFQAAWGGIASLSLGLPAIWTEARRRGGNLGQLARWMGEGPAAFAGVRGQKGRIAPGHDADLTVWDPEAAFVLRPEQLFFRHKVTPYEGHSLTGRVHRTLLRGRTVYDGEGHPEPASGKPLLHRREPA
jgi:allantoinase